MGVREMGLELEGPGLRSERRTVFCGVPSVCQSSVPVVPSLAEKQTVSLTLVRVKGVEEGEGVWNDLT